MANPFYIIQTKDFGRTLYVKNFDPATEMWDFTKAPVHAMRFGHPTEAQRYAEKYGAVHPLDEIVIRKAKTTIEFTKPDNVQRPVNLNRRLFVYKTTGNDTVRTGVVIADNPSDARRKVAERYRTEENHVSAMIHQPGYDGHYPDVLEWNA